MVAGLDLLRFTQGIIVVLGAFLTYCAVKGYRRKKDPSLLFLGVGFGLVTIGAAVAGLLFELLDFDLVYADQAEALAQVAGFLVIIYSIVGDTKRSKSIVAR